MDLIISLMLFGMYYLVIKGIEYFGTRIEYVYNNGHVMAKEV